MKLCEIDISAKPSSPKDSRETVTNEVSILAIMWGSTTFCPYILQPHDRRLTPKY